MPREDLMGDKLRPRDSLCPSGGPGEPWYTLDGVMLLAKILRKNFVCFEWGAGASTLWIANRVKHLTTIEHNKEWFEKVFAVVTEEGLKNIDVRYEWAKRNEYTKCIRAFPDEYFDAIFVDGAGGPHRRKAVIEAVPKLKPFGLLLVDDSHHLKCSGCVDFLRYWAQVDTFNNKRSTTFFFKPKQSVNEGFRKYNKPV